MTTRSNNTNSGSAPQLGRNTGTPAGGANLRAAQTLAVRVRWNTAANGYDQIALAYYANGAFDGIYLGRRTSATGNVVNAWRSNAGYTAWNIAASTAAGYANTTDWVHLCATYDATTLRLYVNGVANGSIASAATFTVSSTNTNLATAWGGLFDQCDAMLFSRVLTDAEILSLARKRSLPTSGRGDCFLWAPMTQSSSIANLGRDFSGRGNNLIAITGTGTIPAVSNISVPFAWGTNYYRPVYVPPAQTALVGTASRSITGGTAALGVSAALLGAASRTATAGGAALDVGAPFATLLSESITGGLATLVSSQPMVTSVSETVTAGIAVLTSSQPMVTSASETVTAGNSTLTSSQPFTATASRSATAGSGALDVPVSLQTQTSKTVTAGTADMQQAIQLSGTASRTATAGAGSLDVSAALVTTASRTATAGLGTLGTSAFVDLLTTASRTQTAGASALTASAALAATASRSTTAGGAALAASADLATAASRSVTAGSGQLDAFAGLLALASRSVTAGAATAAVSADFVTLESRTSTSGQGTLDGGTPIVPVDGGGSAARAYNNQRRVNLGAAGRRVIRT